MGSSIKPVEITNAALWEQKGISPVLTTLFSFYVKPWRTSKGKIVSDSECEILSLLSYRTSFFLSLFCFYYCIPVTCLDCAVVALFTLFFKFSERY